MKMNYTDYSIEAILGWNVKQENYKKIEIKEERNESEIMKYYNREKYPTIDQLEQISLQLDIKPSTLKTWYRNQRQQERKTLQLRSQKCSSSTVLPEDHTSSPESSLSRSTTPSPQRTVSSSQQRTITPSPQRTITPRPSSPVESPPSGNNSSHHPYFQLISEKIGISPPQTNQHGKTSPTISHTLGQRVEQSSPLLPNQSQTIPQTLTVPKPLPLYHPYSQPYSQLYYGSPYFQYPVSTPSSLDNIQPLDLSKPVGQYSPENHGRSPTNHVTKQLINQSSPESRGTKQSTTSPEQIYKNKQHSPVSHGNIKCSHDHTVKSHQFSPEHQARMTSSPESVNDTTTKTRTKRPKTSKPRSTPSPKSILLSPPEKVSHFGSGLRQLVIEGRSFSP